MKKNKPMKIDFEGINRAAKNRSRDLLEAWTPGGKYRGDLYIPCNPTREDKKPGSFKINYKTGIWNDYATGEGGGDFIDLYGYLFGHKTQGEAAKALAEDLRIRISPISPRNQKKKPPKQAKLKSWTVLRPVPENSSEPPQKHPKLGSPSMIWTYRNEKGQLMSYVWRFDMRDGSKIILPLTFCTDENWNRAWQWQAQPELRSLYGLELLASTEKNVPVLVVEGEKAADAARNMLSDSMTVITWQSGSKATHMTDWGPLNEHSVFLWPDADKPGFEAALSVTEFATIAQAKSIGIVPPPSDAPKGWDLADATDWTREKVLDWIEKNKLDREAFKRLALERYNIGDKSKKETLPSSQFNVTKDGVYFKEITRDGDIEEQWLCSPLDVLGVTRDEDNQNWGRLLQITDLDGVAHKWAMPMEMTSGNGEPYRQQLANLGLQLAGGTKSKTRLHQYITQTTSDARALCVKRTGWHSDKFVLHDHTYGSIETERTILQGQFFENPYRCRGNLKDWQESVGMLCVGNSRLVFAVSLAFAAVMLHHAGAESGGFNLIGPSSIGKTTILQAAASVCGGGGDNGYIRSWRATDNGIEAIAASHCDTLLCLDEMGQATGANVAESAYMLANGMGKVRATKNGTNAPINTWRSTFLSTGEISLEQKIMEDPRLKVHAGQTVRIVDIQADAGGGFGAFEELHNLGNGDEFAQKINRTSTSYYGTPLRAFLEKATEDLNSVRKRLNAINEQFYTAHCPPKADGQVKRVCRRFAHGAAAGELAVEIGVLPWKPAEATKAALTCFHNWLDTRGGAGAAEVRDSIRQIRAFFEKNGSTRFELASPHEREGNLMKMNNSTSFDRHNRAGFRVTQLGYDEYEYWVLPEVFRNEICKGFDHKMVCRELIKQDILSAGNNGGYQMNKRLPGMGQKKVYVINSGIFEE